METHVHPRSIGHLFPLTVGMIVAGLLAAFIAIAPTFAASVGVDMPITGAVVEVVEGRASIEDMGRMLLARPQKMDGWKIELV